MIYLLTAIGLPPGGSSTVHIYAQTIHRTTQSTQKIRRPTQLTNWEECGPCPVFASYTLAFALQLRKKQGKTSFRVAGELNKLYKTYNHLKKTKELHYTAILRYTAPQFAQLHFTKIIDTSYYNKSPSINTTIS